MTCEKHLAWAVDGERFVSRVIFLHRLKSFSQKGRQSGPPLSQQVRSLIGDGNQAYVDSNLREAIRIMQEVIRIEPRAAPAWSVLAQCYEDMNEHQKALQLRIMAAHLMHDADEWDRLARQSRYSFTYTNCTVLTYIFGAESLGITNKHCIATARYAAWIQPMSTRSGIAPPSPKRQATSKPYIHPFPSLYLLTNTHSCRPASPTSGSSSASHTTSQFSPSCAPSSSSSLISLPAHPSSSPHLCTTKQHTPPGSGWTPPPTRPARYREVDSG